MSSVKVSYLNEKSGKWMYDYTVENCALSEFINTLRDDFGDTFSVQSVKDRVYCEFYNKRGFEEMIMARQVG